MENSNRRYMNWGSRTYSKNVLKQLIKPRMIPERLKNLLPVHNCINDLPDSEKPK